MEARNIVDIGGRVVAGCSLGSGRMIGQTGGDRITSCLPTTRPVHLYASQNLLVQVEEILKHLTVTDASEVEMSTSLRLDRLAFRQKHKRCSEGLPTIHQVIKSRIANELTGLYQESVELACDMLEGYADTRGLLNISNRLAPMGTQVSGNRACG
jgi:hypothetical protein